MKIRAIQQPALCSACGRLLIPKEDYVLDFKSVKTGKQTILMCPQCVQTAAYKFIDWEVERNLPKRS